MSSYIIVYFTQSYVNGLFGNGFGSNKISSVLVTIDKIHYIHRDRKWIVMNWTGHRAQDDQKLWAKTYGKLTITRLYI